MTKNTTTPLAAETIDAHLTNLTLTRAISDETAARYRRDLLQLAHVSDDLSCQELLRWIGTSKNGTPVAPRSFNRRLAVARGLMNFLVRSGVVEDDPLRGIKRQQVPAAHKVPISPQELRRMMRSCDEQRIYPWMCQRDRAIIQVLYTTGLRVSELVRMEVVDLDEEQLLLRGARRKGGVHTDEHIPEQALAALRAWIAVRPEADDDAMFVSRAKRRMSVRSVQKRLKLLARRANIQSKTNPHELRHGHATAMARNANIKIIQASMRHSSIKTTALYVHTTDQRVREARDQLPDISV